MSLVLKSNIDATIPGMSFTFAGQGGTEPYTYEVLADGAGGTIGVNSGIYIAPSSANPDPKKSFDTIQVTDALAATATKRVLVAPPYRLVCDILQKEMDLEDDRVYLYNQKIFEPTDNGLFIAVKFIHGKTFGNTNRPSSVVGGLDSDQSINVMGALQMDIISRDLSALYRKEEILMALNSDYAQNQYSANSFSVALLSKNFLNLSGLDGSAIPYRFNIEMNIFYFQKKTSPVDYFDDFSSVEVTTEP